MAEREAIARRMFDDGADIPENGTLSTLRFGHGDPVPEGWSGRCCVTPAKCGGICEGECMEKVVVRG